MAIIPRYGKVNTTIPGPYQESRVGGGKTPKMIFFPLPRAVEPNFEKYIEKCIDANSEKTLKKVKKKCRIYSQRKRSFMLKISEFERDDVTE